MLHFKRPNSIRDAAYKHLRQAILSGVLLPGKRISEPALAEQLGLSRTPIREALQYLAKEGLVDIIPHKGARVRRLSLQEIKEVYQVRAVLEAEGARLAALYATPQQLMHIESLLETLHQIDPQDFSGQRQADMAFHAAFVAAGHNKTLEQLFNDLQASLSLLRNYTSNLSQSPDTRQQHQNILEAIRHQWPDQAANAAKTHVLFFLDLILEREQGLANNPGES